MVWEGTSDARDPASLLNPMLKQITDTMTRGPVSIDLRKLEYINSASVGPLLGFIRALDSKSISTIVVYDTDVDWQRIHYQCMKAMARTLTAVEVKTDRELVAGAASP